MSNHMNLLECMEWAAGNGFNIELDHDKERVYITIVDKKEILPFIEYVYKFGSDQNFEKDLATIISDLYFEREEKNEI